MPHALFERWNAISLRTKITGVTVLVLTLGLLVSGAGTMVMLKRVLLEQIDQQLVSLSRSQTDLNAFLQSNSSSSARDAAEKTPSEFYIAIYNSQGQLIQRNWKERANGELPIPPATLTVATTYRYDSSNAILTLTDAAGDSQFHAMAVLVDIGGDSQGSALIAVSTDGVDTVIGNFIAIFLGFGFLVVVIGAVLTRLLVTTTFGPLRQVERTAAAIAEGDFSQRLGGATPNTEVGRLSRSLNTMLNRIDGALKDRARTIDQMRRFVGDASHELRTPLVSVRGYAELYRMGALQSPDEVGQAMERIEKEAIRMGGLVEDLLVLARLDETRPLQAAPVDLIPLARDASLDANAANPGRRVGVDVRLPPVPRPPAPVAEDAPVPPPLATPRAGTAANLTGPISFAGATFARLRASRRRRPETDGGLLTRPLPIQELPEEAVVPPIVMADENKLRQILGNLIGNAIRYTPPETPIEIGVRVDLDTERAILEVRDHGDGIPPEIRDQIFQRFWRADTSRTRETGGSGLGLAIVSSIVASHNGSVEVVETPGGGATFRVSLPLASSPAAPQPPAPAPAPAD